MTTIASTGNVYGVTNGRTTNIQAFKGERPQKTSFNSGLKSDTLTFGNNGQIIMETGKNIDKTQLVEHLTKKFYSLMGDEYTRVYPQQQFKKALAACSSSENNLMREEYGDLLLNRLEKANLPKEAINEFASGLNTLFKLGG